MNEDKAARYHRIRRRVSVLSTSTAALVLLVVLATGMSGALRDAAGALTAGSFSLTVAVYTIWLALLVDAVQLPLRYFQLVTLERRYGLSTETAAHWWQNHLKASGMALLFGVGVAEAMWHFLRVLPDWWWVTAAASFSLVLVSLAHVAPVVLPRVFDGYGPLDRPKLHERLVALADRAGTGVAGVFTWRLAGRTRKANAALAGIGRTRRILLSDTLLADHSDDEIEVIVAHELGHHVHRDIWSGMGLEILLTTFGFYCADLVLTYASATFGLTGKADVAGMPLLILAAGAVSLVFLPVANALSRAHERRADRYALEMTGNAPAFVSAIRRLGATNLAEEQPSAVVEALFHSHPSVAARVAAANSWAQARAGLPWGR